MSDEKRALTWPSAPPSEADYEAILAAVMETGRGRWFLHEYAQRNRHAETRGVLGAIQRIENLLRAQGGTAPEAMAHPAAAQIAEAIARARSMLGSVAEREAVRGFEQVARLLETAQVRLRAATTRLQDTAAALREEGGHTRICNDLDRQTRELETGLAQLDDTAGDVRILVGLLYDIETELTAPRQDVPPPAAAPATEPLAAIVEAAPPAGPQDPETAADNDDQAAPELAVEPQADVVPAVAPVIETPVAVEQAAIAVATAAETRIVETAIATPEIAAPAGADAPAGAVPSASAQHPSPEPARPVSGPADFLLEPLPDGGEDAAAEEPAVAPAPPAPAKAQPQRKQDLRIDNFDPLAPLRALSEEEKIALFS